MRRWLALAAAALVLASAAPLAPASASLAATANGGFELLGGRSWSPDIPFTQNGETDTQPQVYVDACLEAHFLWRKTDGPAPGYYHAARDRYGVSTQDETFITGHTVASPGAQYLQGPAIGIDDANDIHVVYDDGPGGKTIHYEKFDRNGSALVPSKNVGPADGFLSRYPSLAVGLDGTAQIAHEEYKFQCQDIAYDKLARDGSDIWIDRLLSSDVTTLARYPLVNVDRFSGGILVTFGSNSGSWVGRMNKFGVKDMPSAKFRNATDYKSSDVVATPEGSIHLAWEDAGMLHYTQLNSTGAKVINDAVLVSNGTVGPFPRLAATSDGSVVITWEDQRTGSWQVMYSVIRPGDNLAAVEQVHLTNSTGSALDPWVTLDPQDNLLIAWSDTRDGNAEIYYKRSFECQVELFAEPITLASGSWIHPNETKEIPFLLKNRGALTANFSVALNFTPGAEALGWGAALNRTSFTDLAPDAVEPLTLTIHAPLTARRGDNISILLNASSDGSLTCFDEVRMSVFVQVSRSLTLWTSQSSKSADNGQNVTFDLIATNKGDVDESAVNILTGGALAPTGWVAASNVSTLDLPSKASALLRVTVEVPDDPALAPGAYPAWIGVKARSASDPSVEASIGLQVFVNLTMSLTMQVDHANDSALPGATAVFKVTLSNIGNKAGPVQVNVEAQQPSLPGWWASLDTETVYLAGGESTDVMLRVGVSPRAIEGERINLTVSALAIRYGLYASASVSVAAEASCGAALAAPSDLFFVGGVARTLSLAVANNGNTFSNISLRLVRAPPDWQVSHWGFDGPVAWQLFPPLWNRTFDLIVAPPASPAAGAYVLSVSMASDLCGASSLSLPLIVAPVRGYDFWAENASAELTPGGETTVDLHVRNTGNVGASVFLSASGLPESYEAWIVLLGADGETQYPASLNGWLSLDAFSEVQVRLHLRAPPTTVLNNFTATVRADFDAENIAILPITVSVLRPDLRLWNATVLSASLSPGQVANFGVTVDNAGTAWTPPGFLRAFLDGYLFHTQAIAPLAPGQRVSLYVPWTAELGGHVVRFEIVPGEFPEDRDPGNDRHEISVFVGGQVAPVPVPPPDYMLPAILVVGGMVLLAVLLWPKKQAPPRRPPPQLAPRTLPRNPK